MKRRTFMGFAGANAVMALGGCTTPTPDTNKTTNTKQETFNTTLNSIQHQVNF